MSAETNIVNFEKFKLKKYLEKNGFEWHEDQTGKVRIWIRKMKKTPDSTGFFFDRNNKH